jgi:hypothetical protein
MKQTAHKIFFCGQIINNFLMQCSEIKIILYSPYNNYSYRKAVIGSSFAALYAGYNPANNPTSEQTITPAITHAHGTTKPVFNSSATVLPKRIPARIPTIAPKMLIKIDSHKN